MKLIGFYFFKNLNFQNFINRVFYDRLCDENDRKWYEERVINLVNENFKFTWTHEEIFSGPNPLIFSKIIDPTTE